MAVGLETYRKEKFKSDYIRSLKSFYGGVWQQNNVISKLRKTM